MKQHIFQEIRFPRWCSVVVACNIVVADVWTPGIFWKIYGSYVAHRALGVYPLERFCRLRVIANKLIEPAIKAQVAICLDTAMLDK